MFSEIFMTIVIRVHVLLMIAIYRAGDKTSDCTTGNVIGRSTGVYVGGLPHEFALLRDEADPRAEVQTNLVSQFCSDGIKAAQR